MAPTYDDLTDLYDPEDGSVHLPPGYRARIIEIEPVDADHAAPDEEVDDPSDHVYIDDDE